MRSSTIGRRAFACRGGGGGLGIVLVIITYAMFFDQLACGGIRLLSTAQVAFVKTTAPAATTTIMTTALEGWYERGKRVVVSYHVPEKGRGSKVSKCILQRILQHALRARREHFPARWGRGA